MLRKLALGLAVLVWWVPAQVFALGLGNIEMKSVLNQPLDAHIELLRARPDELKDLNVTLASQDTFRRAGIERPAFLSNLKFEVVTNPEGNPYIQVRSTQPITEPFLNFLLEINWPNGRLLREFTVLVDPPVLTDVTPGVVEAPLTQPSEGQVVDLVGAGAEQARIAAQAAPLPSGAIEIPIPPRPREVTEPTPVTIPVQPAPVESVATVDPAAEAVAAFDGSTPGEPAAPLEPVPANAIDITEEPAASAPEAVPERPRATREEVREPAVATREEAADGALEYGPTKTNDTLWEIAAKMRPDKSVSIPQLMIALLENNPEAFVGNNINNLRRGAVLRLADTAEATKISKAEAARIADLQWEQWKESRGLLVGSTPSRTGGAEREVEPSEARVRLVSPGEGEAEAGDAAPGAASTGSTRVASRLKRDLSVAQEGLDAQRRETQEMRERVVSLEEQVATMQRLVQLKDSQLAALQGQAAQQTEAGAAASAEPVPSSTATAPAEAATPAAKPEPKTEPAAAKPQPGLVAGLMNDPKLIGLAAVVLGLVVLLTWLFIRRRKMQSFQESILTLNEAVSEPTSAQTRPESEDASFMSDFAVSSMEGIQTEINEVDPLSEADVYLAYGRYKQAEELITQAIEKNPQRAELKMKLLEIHYAAKDHEAFELQAELVRDDFSAQHPELWSRVLEMGRELAPGSALFGGAGVAAAPATASGAGGDFDLGDLNLGEAAQTDAGDLSLDFDLDADTAPAPAAKAKPAKAEAADDNLLDFDLGDLKLHDEQEPAVADDRSLDFDLSAFDAEKAPAGESAAATDDHALDFDFSSLDQAAEPEIAFDAAPAADDANALEFDLGDFKAEAAPKAKEPAAKREANVVDFKSKPAVQLEEQPTFEAATEGGGDIEGDLDEALFADVDEVGTKLDLAKAYIDMGDSDGARSILDEVMEEGDDTQKQEAQVLMRQIG